MNIERYNCIDTKDAFQIADLMWHGDDCISSIEIDKLSAEDARNYLLRYNQGMINPFFRVAVQQDVTTSDIWAIVNLTNTGDYMSGEFSSIGTLNPDILKRLHTASYDEFKYFRDSLTLLDLGVLSEIAKKDAWEDTEFQYPIEKGLYVIVNVPEIFTEKSLSKWYRVYHEFKGITDTNVRVALYLGKYRPFWDYLDMWKPSVTD